VPRIYMCVCACVFVCVCVLNKSTLLHTRKNLGIHETNLFYHTVPNNMKADHPSNFNSLAIHKFAK